MRAFGLILLVLVAFGPAATARAEQVVLFLGDSLTAGFGVQPDEAYPQLLAERLAAEGYRDVRIVNGSISGSTTAGAVNRLNWYARLKPSVLVLALGANDGLRGLEVAAMERNLAATIELARKMGMRVLLAGMELPPNYGDAYTSAFRKVYRTLAERYQLVLIPFLLEGVGGVAEFNQADGIHPNAAGHRRIAALVYPFLKQFLEPPHDR